MSKPSSADVARPSRAEVAGAAGRTIPDLLRPGLDVVFCGINPGLYSAATGWHFARPGNRFWRVLHLAGFTPRQIHPSEQETLLDMGIGITNVVARATATAAELGAEELRAGAGEVREKVRRLRPRCLAIVGIGAYRTGFERPSAVVGPQDEVIGSTRLWVLPNPSGLNANYQIDDLTRAFAALRAEVLGAAGAAEGSL